MRSVEVEINENKYEVSFDEEELRNFRNEVIENASLVTHHDYVGHHGPFYKMILPDPLEIRNYSALVRGSDEKGMLIRYVYDKYTFPALANHIGKLLDGDNLIFEKIYYPTYSDENVLILNEINILSNEIFSSGESRLDENRIDHVNELIALLIKYRNGDYEIPIQKYYEEVKNLFDVKRVDKCKTLTKE